MIPGSNNPTNKENAETIKVYRELLELCDFLLLSSSPSEQSEAAEAVLKRLEVSRSALGRHVYKLEDALGALESAAKQVTSATGLPVLVKENILKARELIEHALQAEETVTDFSFEDSLSQIESLCNIIHKNGPSVEGELYFSHATDMISLIAAYRKDPDPSIAGQISVLLKKMEPEPRYGALKTQQYTGRPASQFKRIWGQLMRQGVDVMHPHKGWVAICDWLRANGEAEEKLPTKAQIEKLYKEWTR